MDDSLFELPSSTITPPTAQSHLATDNQILQIREAFTQAKIEGQRERQLLIEKTIGREIASLRELTSLEVRPVLYRINDLLHSRSQQPSGSAWDERDEDTWIDKM